LHAPGILATCDAGALAAYCVAFQRWRQAEAALAEMAKRDPATGALLLRGARKNPLVGISSRAADAMVRFAAHFGMTTAARSRIAAGPNDQPPSNSKFTGLLG
jgi:P27 family predicted phage terminase small subunit